MHISSAPSVRTIEAGIEISFEPELPVIYKFWYDEIGFHAGRIDEGQNLTEVRDIGLTIFRKHIANGISDIASAFQHVFDEDFSNFIATYRKYQCAALILSFGRPHVYSFARENRFLFWFLCHHFAANEITKDEIAEIIKKPRRDILFLLFGQEENKYIKYLEKVSLDNWGGVEFRFIAKTLQNPVFALAFRHWKSIPLAALKVLDKYPFLSGSKILHRFSNASTSPSVYSLPIDIERLYFDTIELGKKIGLKNCKPLVDSCDSTESLRKLHDSWTKVLNNRKKPLLKDKRLPVFPLSIESWMSPLVTVNDVLEEANVMEHCLASYIDKLLLGYSYVFRIHTPERATCELIKRGTRFEISQLVLKNNAEANEDTWRKVNEWLGKENDALLNRNN